MVAFIGGKSFPKVKFSYLCHGERPYKNVMVEDYELSQAVWHEQAVKEGKSFIVFSSPAEFEKNISIIDKNANIYIDSNFPNTELNGEDWSEKVSGMGYKNLFMCTTKKLN